MQSSETLTAVSSFFSRHCYPYFNDPRKRLTPHLGTTDVGVMPVLLGLLESSEEVVMSKMKMIGSPPDVIFPSPHALRGEAAIWCISDVKVAVLRN